MKVNVPYKKLNSLAKTPVFGSEQAAGADLYAATDYDIIIQPHQEVSIGTGLAMAVPIGFWGGIYARSGTARKQGLRPSNCVGVIDSDYRGEIIVSVRNDTDIDQIIPAGSRIAQFIVEEKIDTTFNEVDELDETERGTGGFGSTGVK